MTTATKAALTTKALVAKARAMGYTKYIKGLVCEECGAEAFKFDCPGKPYIMACVKGHRSLIAKQSIPTKTKCKTADCPATVYNLEITTNDGYCWNCRPKTAASTQVEETTTGKICATEGCTNPVPKGKKAYCCTCRPPKTKAVKEAAQQVVM